MIKKIIIGVVSIILIGGIYGYYQYNKEHRDIAKEEAIIKISAINLFQEYVDDEVSANLKYLDNVIEVFGVVSEISNTEGSEMVVLQTQDDFFGINLYFEDPKSVSNLTEGEELLIKGRCTGGDEMGVVLTNCTIIKN